MQSIGLWRNPLTWGAAALAVLAAVALVAGWVYVSPPGEHAVIFYTDDAASVRQGDEVRMAGIPVGKITGLSLEGDRVRVRSDVANSAFVGNESTIEVRMLTVVGGYYVNLISLGNTPLGNAAIPQERVTMPYSLIRTLNDATKITDNVNPQPINQSLNQIQNGLNGTNIETLNSVIEAGNTIMSTVDRQRGQITKILNLSDEYIQQISAIRGELKQMIEKIAIVQATLETTSKGFGEALMGLGQAVYGMSPIGHFYAEHRDQIIQKVRQFLVDGRMWINRNGVIVRGLRDIQRHVERVLDVENQPPELLATDLCIPMPGIPC
jgi:phospholipid/cholesterol/gamma-HCH transport system substrate-binding protein